MQTLHRGRHACAPRMADGDTARDTPICLFEPVKYAEAEEMQRAVQA